MNDFASRARTIRFIQEVSKSPVAFDTLEKSLQDLPKEELTSELLNCGIIPEIYTHDSSEEKLWAKYCDVLLAQAFNYLNISAEVLRARGNSADVYGKTPEYTIVGDAKAFRLSRTAKNQKDFKIEAMHGWKRGKTHAMVVCPIYQLPARASQIYQQAIAKNVCIFSYSHLAVILRFREALGKRSAQGLLLAAMKCIEALNPAKDSVAYWTCLNRAMLQFHAAVAPIWAKEKVAMVEGLAIAKEEALTFLAKEREEIMRMTRKLAIAHLIGDRNIDGREKVIRGVEDNGILSMA